MILVDRPRWPAHGTRFAHLVSDASTDELHAFADACRRDRADPDADRREVARGDDGHTDDPGLGRSVRDLPDLPFVPGYRRGEHADASFATVVGVVLRHGGRREPDHVERADQI